MGIIGRVDDMITVRGENVYPSEIDAALNATPGYGGEHRIIVSRDGTMDEMAVRVEAAEDIWAIGGAAKEAFRQDVAARLQTLLGLRAGVDIVAPNTIDRTDFKARRVIDDRQVLRDVLRELEGASS
jgi:phenylacetate-CoA ligase